MTPSEAREDRVRRSPLRRVAGWVLGVAAIGGVVALAWGEIAEPGPILGAFTPANFRAVAKTDGRVAPDFELPKLGGGTVTLSATRGKVVVVNLWATWCAPCRREAPDLEEVWRRYADRGVAFIGVNERDQESAAIAFQEEFGITYPSGFDPSGRVGFLYEITGMPETFVVSPDGKIVYRFVGILSAPVLSAAIDDALRAG